MIALLLRARDAKHVAVFTIHEPPNAPADRVDRAEAMVFVADGFSWTAASLAPLWLASHQLWMALGAYLVVASAVAISLYAIGAGTGWMLVGLMTLNVWLGFEASEIWRRGLSAKSWADRGSVSGRNLAECERRFFDMWLAGQPVRSRNGADRNDGPLPSSEAAVFSDAASGGPPRGHVSSPGHFLKRLFAAKA